MAIAALRFPPAKGRIVGRWALLYYLLHIIEALSTKEIANDELDTLALKANAKTIITYIENVLFHIQNSVLNKRSPNHRYKITSSMHLFVICC